MLVLLATLAALGASTISGKITRPASGPVVWRPIPDPANPGRFLPSSYSGGTVLAIPAANTGIRTVMWKKTGLTQGYYEVAILYQQNAGNAKKVRVQTLGSFSSWLTLPTPLDQSTGGTPSTAQTTPVNGWLPVYKVLTPKGSYIQVGAGGSISIRISDSGCDTGRMVADTIRLTYSTTK